MIEDGKMFDDKCFNDLGHHKGLLFWYSSVHQKRSEAEPSCVSMKSGQSTDNLIDFKSGDTQTAIR